MLVVGVWMANIYTDGKFIKQLTKKFKLNCEHGQRIEKTNRRVYA